MNGLMFHLDQVQESIIIIKANQKKMFFCTFLFANADAFGGNKYSDTVFNDGTTSLASSVPKAGTLMTNDCNDNQYIKASKFMFIQNLKRKKSSFDQFFCLKN